MVHTECYCRHHFGTDPTCTMWYNLMIMYTYFWMITILNRDFLGLTTISYQSEFVVKKPHATLQWNPPIGDTMGLLLQSGL